MKKKIAIPCIGQNLNWHFGRAQTFEVFAIKDGKIIEETIINILGHEHQHEGIAMLLKNKGVEAVICGGIGAGAIAGLQAAGLEVLRGASGSVQEIAQAYAEGTFSGTDKSCDHSHINCMCYLKALLFQIPASNLDLLS